MGDLTLSLCHGAASCVQRDLEEIRGETVKWRPTCGGALALPLTFDVDQNVTRLLFEIPFSFFLIPRKYRRARRFLFDICQKPYPYGGNFFSYLRASTPRPFWVIEFPRFLWGINRAQRIGPEIRSSISLSFRNPREKTRFYDFWRLNGSFFLPDYHHPQAKIEFIPTFKTFYLWPCKFTGPGNLSPFPPAHFASAKLPGLIGSMKIPPLNRQAKPGLLEMTLQRATSANLLGRMIFSQVARNKNSVCSKLRI